MSLPLISILVPVYKVEKYIEKCATSLLCQTYPNLELIFVDDCSPDRSIDILRRVISGRKNVKIISHLCNRGLSAARNSALRSSTGEYVMHVDSDDYLEVETVEKLYQSIIVNDSDAALCDVNFVYKNKSKIYDCRCPGNKLDYINLLLSRKTLFNMFGKLYKRNVVFDNNLFSIEGLNQGEDFAVYPKIAYHLNKISYVNEPLYNYNQTNSNSYTKNMDQKGRHDIIKSANILLNFFGPKLFNSPAEYILYNLMFYNKVTLYKITDREDYQEIHNLYPELLINKPKISGFKEKLMYFLIKQKLGFFIFTMLRLNQWANG